VLTIWEVITIFEIADPRPHGRSLNEPHYCGHNNQSLQSVSNAKRKPASVANLLQIQASHQGSLYHHAKVRTGKTVFIDVGNGNLVSAARILRVETPRRGDMQRMKRTAGGAKPVIDARSGAHARAFIHLDSEHVVVSPLTREQLVESLSALLGTSTPKTS
jgi:regulator of extracellular matrix RemA (YlzA/DUF370 family)